MLTSAHLLRPPIRDPEVQARFRATLDLHDMGVAMKRQYFRRQHPEASEAEIDQLVRDWLAAPDRTGPRVEPTR